MTDNILDDYLTAEELSKELGISVRTLYRLNSIGKGPPKTKIGKRALYRVAAARDWLKANEHGQVRAKR